MVIKKNYVKNYSVDGLNQKVFDFSKKFLNKDSRILVLASGEGAIEQRLLASGFKNIVSVELYTKFRFVDKVSSFIKTDLNKSNFAKIIKKKSGFNSFDVIFAVELIEHVYSTNNFLKNVSALLDEKGIFLVSTPNVHSLGSRIDILLTGYPSFFSPINLPYLGGHVNPIYGNILKHFLKLNGLKIIKCELFYSYLRHLIDCGFKSLRSVSFFLFRLFLFFLLQPFMFVNRKNSKKTGIIYFIKKI